MNFYDVLPEEKEYFSKEQIKDINDALKLYFNEKLTDTVEEDLIEVIKLFLMNNSCINFENVSSFLALLIKPFDVLNSLELEYKKDEISELVYPVLKRINGTYDSDHSAPIVERSIMVNGKQVHLEIDVNKGELAYRPEDGTWEVTEL